MISHRAPCFDARLAATRSERSPPARGCPVAAKRAIACIAWVFAASIAFASGDVSLREERALRAAAERVAPSVVTIETVGGASTIDGASLGTGPSTGLVVSPDGYIVSSAFNFAQKPASILVTLDDGKRVAAKLVATDRNRMLTLLKISVDRPLPVPESSPENELRVGQWSVAVGRSFERSQPNLSVGIISGLNRVWGKAIQTDARISPNNYGGPLVDIHGRVIGVLVPLSPEKNTEAAGVEWYDSGIGFAVPLAQLRLDDLKRGSDLHSGLMGVSLKPGDLFADPPVIHATRANSPAAKAGLKRGDRVVAIDGAPLQRMVQFTGAMQRHYSGDTVHLEIVRGDERLPIELELVSKIDPYERPFLGILPLETESGVGMRYIYAGSAAAEAGLEPGDVIVALDGKAVHDSSELASAVAACAQTQVVMLKVQRAGETVELKATLGHDTAVVPHDLPARSKPGKAKKDGDTKTGQYKIEVGEYTNECVVYVPKTYDPRRSYGLMMWLHGSDKFDADAIVKRWKSACERDQFILMVPRCSGDAWKIDDLDFVVRAHEQALIAYNIDPLRVAIDGHQIGGALACVFTFNDPDHIRGLAVVQSRVVAKTLPEADPEHRLSFYIAGSSKIENSEKIEELEKLKHPVVSRKLDDKASDLTDEQFAELLRWFDSLDRI